MIIKRGSVWKLTPYSARSNPLVAPGFGEVRWLRGGGVGLAFARGCPLDAAPAGVCEYAVAHPRVRRIVNEIICLINDILMDRAGRFPLV